MGLKSSPYQAVQAVMVAKEFVMGDRKDPANAFRWDVVRLNLPGSKDYDPAMPWVSKVRLDDGHVACDLFIYVDDGRVCAPQIEPAIVRVRDRTDSQCGSSPACCRTPSCPGSLSFHSCRGV